MDTSLEHFTHIEDVVAFVKKHLPAEADAEAWKNICENVMHCELRKVEPLLTKQLAEKDAHHHSEEDIRALLRATSWYTHPQLSREALLAQVENLKKILEPNISPDTSDQLEMIRIAIQDQMAGHEALAAAEAIEALLKSLNANPTLTNTLTPAHELRDQIYYQLLYPHWFAIVHEWKQDQTKTATS
jgi:hypothetical protein